MVFLHLWFYLNASGVLDGVKLSQAHAQPPRENVWQRRTLAVVNALHLGLSQGQWQAVTMDEFVREVRANCVCFYTRFCAFLRVRARSCAFVRACACLCMFVRMPL